MARRKVPHTHNLYQDIGVIALSIFIAGLLSKSGFFDLLATQLGNLEVVGLILAGVLFTSVFTTAPAIVLLGTLAQTHPIWLIAIWGTVGALIGDYLIFWFIRDHFSEDILSFLSQHKHKQFRKVLRLPFARWLLATLGMIIIASPLPDELGITLLGFAKTRKSVFMVLSIIANCVGIVIIALVARQI